MAGSERLHFLGVCLVVGGGHERTVPFTACRLRHADVLSHGRADRAAAQDVAGLPVDARQPAKRVAETFTEPGIKPYTPSRHVISRHVITRHVITLNPFNTCRIGTKNILKKFVADRGF